MHPEAVRPELWEFLQRLMSWQPLEGFVLVGGTSLALRSGYRESVGIDLFCHPAFDQEQFRHLLQDAFRGISFTSVSTNGIFATYKGIKLDLVEHRQPWMENHEMIQGVRLVSLKDLAAMKVNAVMGRGSKKDFSDLLYLHENGLSLAMAVTHFARKYSKDLLFSAIRSLNYFGETEEEFDPLYRNGWTWSSVRDRMTVLAAELARTYRT